MAIFDKFTGAALRLFIRELRDTKQVLRDGIDSYRTIHGLPPLYLKVEPMVETKPTGKRRLIESGDFLTIWVIEELAREMAVPYDVDTDLEQLAKDRGWVDGEGHFTMMPQTARPYLGDEAVAVLMGEPQVTL